LANCIGALLDKNRTHIPYRLGLGLVGATLGDDDEAIIIIIIIIIIITTIRNEKKEH